MSKLYDLIKLISTDVIRASSLSDIMFGTVKSINPLSIKLEDSVTLTKGFLCMTNNLKETGLSTNDKVVLIRKAGGQKYLILDKVVNS